MITSFSVGVFCAVISAFCFGMLAILGKVAGTYGLSSHDILLFRFGFASVLLSVYYIVIEKSALVLSVRTFIKVFLLGFILYPIQSYCYIESLRYVSAATTSIVFYTYPLIVTLLAVIIFKQTLHRSVVTSILLLLVGSTLVFYDALTRSLSITGVSYAFFSVLIFSLYMILLQHFLRNENPKTITFYTIVSAAFAFGITSHNLPTITFQSLWIGLLLGLIPTALAVSLLYKAVSLIGSTYVSIFSAMEPIVTVVASLIVLGETIQVVQVCGMMLIVFGIVIPNAGVLRIASRFKRPASSSIMPS